MDFSEPYRVISPTLEGPILRALSRVESTLTRTQILTMVESASESGVRKALSRLVEQGIVIEETLANRYIYRANRDHLLWPHVEGLLGARQMFRDRTRRVTASWEIPPVSVELCGSVARGEADEDSDIDLLIVRPALAADEEEKWESQVGSLSDQITRWTGNLCEVVVMDRTELRAAHEHDEPLLRSPMISVAGRPLRAVLAALASRQETTLDEALRSGAHQSATHSQLRDAAVEATKLLDAQEAIAALVSSPRVRFALEGFDLGVDLSRPPEPDQVLLPEVLTGLISAGAELSENARAQR